MAAVVQHSEEISNSQSGPTPTMTALVLDLVARLDSHDPLLAGHGERVSAYSNMIGREIGLSGDDRTKLRWSALIHDAGKLGIDTNILTTEERPTELQWSEIRGHPADGRRIVAPLEPWLGEWLTAVQQHHERLDGSGYPDGLRGADIGLPGRIVAIADSFDVITSWRSYKSPSLPARGRALLARDAGSEFDPELVRAFLNVSIGEIMPIVQKPN